MCAQRSDDGRAQTCPTPSRDPTTRRPDDPADCCIAIEADIGPVGQDGEERFNFEVCTPSALARRLDRDDRPFWGHGKLIIGSFTRDAVEAALHQYVRSVSGDNWSEIAQELNRFLDWEFGDYQPHTAR
jgi:hypothetical protein